MNLRAWSLVVSIALCLLVASAPAQASREVELTFDDGPDGSGTADGQTALDNLEDKQSVIGVDPITATFTGLANRSAVTDGRYGRAADFPGGQGAIEISPWSGFAAFGAYLWLQPRDTTTGTILEHPGSYAVYFENNQIMIAAHRGVGDIVTRATGLTWPTDGAFHQLFFAYDISANPPQAALRIDDGDVVQLDLGFTPLTSTQNLMVASGYDGLLDELLLLSHATPWPDDLLDRDPAACQGYSCTEETIIVTPTEFSHPVPARYKSVWDPAVCTASSPCPLLFAISGGATCGDDYMSVAPYVEAGFFTVTVDPFCAANGTTRHFPQETSQLVAVKNAVLAPGATHRALIAGDDYVATGCSHGGRTVTLWSLREEDYPIRTYARAGANSGLCGYFAGVYCPAVQADREAMLGGLPIDIEDPDLRAWHQEQDVVGFITADIAATREFARSWGVNTAGPVCNADGSWACSEEGMRDATYTSRRFRDLWLALQPTDRPSGYFVEDTHADCVHCADPGTPAFECGLCMLKHGRDGMATYCPDCVSYARPGTSFGGASELCPIESSWYTDPLESIGIVDPPTDPPPDSGCGGCATVEADSPWMLALLLLALLWRRRRGQGTHVRS